MHSLNAQEIMSIPTGVLFHCSCKALQNWLKHFKAQVLLSRTTANQLQKPLIKDLRRGSV
jgi:hypothetical protein